MTQPEANAFRLIDHLVYAAFSGIPKPDANAWRLIAKRSKVDGIGLALFRLGERHLESFLLAIE